jgi:hypothetical protein
MPLPLLTHPDGNAWLVQEVTTRLPSRIGGAGTAFASTADLASALRRAGPPTPSPEAHGVVAPFPPLRPRRELARLVCRLHGGGAGRDRLAP